MISITEFTQLIDIYNKVSAERKIVPSLDKIFFDIFSIYINPEGILILKEFLLKGEIVVVYYDLLGYTAITIDDSSKLYYYLQGKKVING